MFMHKKFLSVISALDIYVVIKMGKKSFDIGLGGLRITGNTVGRT